MEQAKLILKITAATWITTLFSTISFGRLTPNAPRSCMEVYRYIYYYGLHLLWPKSDWLWMDGWMDAHFGSWMVLGELWRFWWWGPVGWAASSNRGKFCFSLSRQFLAMSEAQKLFSRIIFTEQDICDQTEYWRLFFSICNFLIIAGASLSSPKEWF